jgi:RNA polymerase sigma factor (sigma-70 family)
VGAVRALVGWPASGGVGRIERAWRAGAPAPAFRLPEPQQLAACARLGRAPRGPGVTFSASERKSGWVFEDFEEVYAEQLGPVWRYVRARIPQHADAEDVTSEVFTRAARSWDRYDARRGSVGAWVLGIARHVVADWSRGRPAEVPLEEIEVPAASDTDPEAVLLGAEARAELRSQLWRLTPKERDAVELRFQAGLRAAEVGSVLGVSETAARMLVYRAVSKLRRVMADE